VSVASNVAEGAARRTTAELVHFLYVARGSLAELETQLEIAVRLGYLGESQLPSDKTGAVGRLLNGLINRLKTT
jgi:four helix bundle protein